jgi:Tfp pilus assembly protein PilV
VEVIAALAILGVALVAVVQLFSTSLESTRRAGLSTMSLMHARALLEEACSAPDPRGMGGSFDLEEGLHAERSVGLLEDGGAGPSLYGVEVTVSAPSGEETRLSCKKVFHEAE